MAEPSKLLQLYFQFVCFLVNIGFFMVGILLCFLKPLGILAKYESLPDTIIGVLFGIACFGMCFLALIYKHEE